MGEANVLCTSNASIASCLKRMRSGESAGRFVFCLGSQTGPEAKDEGSVGST